MSVIREKLYAHPVYQYNNEAIYTQSAEERISKSYTN
jgi:hypothetical protein